MIDRIRPYAAIYTRVSTGQQERDGASLETQEAAARAYCAEHDYEVVSLYREVHTRMELWERDEMTRLRDAMRLRSIDVVVMHALDRLSGEPIHQALVLAEADHYGVKIEFVTEPLEDTPEGWLIRFVRGYSAKVEHEKIKERTMRGLRHRVESGKPRVGPRAPYGYAWNSDKSACVIDPVNATTVREMFGWASEGMPLRDICRRLNDRGTPSPMGGTWFPETVRWILREQRYTGHAETMRFQTQKVDGKRKISLRPPEERAALPDGTFPAMIDDGTFAAVQERLARQRQTATRNSSHPEAFLLRAGFIRCGQCGRPMAAFYGRYPRYSCYSSMRTPGSCNRLSIVAASLDEAVWNRVSNILTNPETIIQELARMQADDPTEADLAIIDRALNETSRKQTNLARALATIDDADAAEPLIRELESIRVRQRDLQNERTIIMQRRVTWQSAQDRLQNVQEWCGKIAERLGELSYEQKRTAIEALGVKVTVYPKDHEPRYTIEASIPLTVTSTA